MNPKLGVSIADMTDGNPMVPISVFKPNRYSNDLRNPPVKTGGVHTTLEDEKDPAVIGLSGVEHLTDRNRSACVEH